MDRRRPDSSWRNAAFAVALLAITFNFLQPLAHAAAIREGAPNALWSVLCRAAAAKLDDKRDTVPTAAPQHECCLGLAHAQLGTEPPTQFTPLEPFAVTVRPLVSVGRSWSTGIRDGPHQPRGPPSFA